MTAVLRESYNTKGCWTKLWSLVTGTQKIPGHQIGFCGVYKPPLPGLSSSSSSSKHSSRVSPTKKRTRHAL
jgi:hypothetical protein